MSTARRNALRALALAAWIGPDLVCIAFLALLLGVVAHAVHWRLHGLTGSTWLPVAALGTFLGAAFLRHLAEPSAVPFARRALAVTRDWAPLVIALVIYDNFHDLTKLVRPDTVDATLAALDVRLLGATPSLALQSWVTPWLTELMTFCYALFFVFPTLVLVRAYARGDLRLFREIAVAFSLAFYLGLVGYLLMPAVGPRYAFPERFTVPLSGPWLTAPASAMWRSLQQVDRDCFPSLHTAMSTIALVYLWRLRALRGGRALLAIGAPLIAGLIFSTMYLRYHYFVDVAAGLALAVACVKLAPHLAAAFCDRWALIVAELALSEVESDYPNDAKIL